MTTFASVIVGRVPSQCVASGSGRGAGAFGADLEVAARVEARDCSTATADRRNPHHGRVHVYWLRMLVGEVTGLPSTTIPTRNVVPPMSVEMTFS